MTLQGARACCWLRKDSEMREYLIEDLQLAAPVLREFLGDAHPECAIVLGSGLNSFADELERKRFLKYADVPYMKVSTGIGHKGRFVLGNVPGTEAKVLCMQGRLHGYEGFTAQEVAYPIWLMHEVGIDTLVTTNAAGSLNPDLRVGDLKEALNISEDRNEKYIFLDKNATLNTVRAAFDAPRERNSRLSVVFITEDGTPRADILAMLTPWDVLRSGV